MDASRLLRCSIYIVAGVVMLLAPLQLFSQSCALCYTQAASSGSKMIEALKSGILVLIVPPTLMTVGLIFIVHRKSNQVRRITEKQDSGQDW